MNLNITALPSNIRPQLDEAILTFVVPAPNGCGLKCPYCFIRQRHEASTSQDLSPSAYGLFIEGVLERERVAAICIQGYEALLPEAFCYTAKILEVALEHNIPTSIVTNGQYLRNYANELSKLQLHDLAVSLDGVRAEHDRYRGEGSFAEAVAGLELAAKVLKSSTKISVASVLIPRQRKQLEPLPAELSRIPVDRWVITLLQKVGRDRPGGPVGDPSEILGDLFALRNIAQQHKIEFVVDDELGALDYEHLRLSFPAEADLSIRRIHNPKKVSRLVPSGHCSIGSDIERQVQKNAPRWSINASPSGEFLARARLSSSYGDLGSTSLA